MQFFDWKTRTVKDTAIEFMGVGMFSYAISVCTVVYRMFFTKLIGIWEIGTPPPS
jgi:hypothetical protein